MSACCACRHRLGKRRYDDPGQETCQVLIFLIGYTANLTINQRLPDIAKLNFRPEGKKCKNTSQSLNIKTLKES